MGASQIARHSVRREARGLRGEALSLAALSALLLGCGLALAELGIEEPGALFLAVGLLCGWHARRKGSAGARFKIGAVAEERVGSRLWKLEEIGWLVEHDVAKSGSGNIDHLVSSPGVTFVIETKAGGSRQRDLAQAWRHREWVAQRYGDGRAIVPVLCIQNSTRRPELLGGVYRVGAAHLVDFLLDRG